VKNYKTIFHKYFQFFKKAIKWFFGILGCIFFISFILSFTDIPYYAYHSLGTSNSKIIAKPNVIVILGGSGMPSPDGLIRTYFGYEAAKKYPEAKIIIALPYNENDSLYQLNLMAKELTIRGIDSSKISYEPLGFNTRSQALNIASMFNNNLDKYNLLIVTSPEHMYRAIKTFKKAGLKIVGGIPTFENPPDSEKIKDKSLKKDLRIKNLSLRYNMWSYLNYELIVTREYFAITYYKIKGWI
jgi:uncharacterized SAM-binding protein YcdF (DUF218 family)